MMSPWMQQMTPTHAKQGDHIRWMGKMMEYLHNEWKMIVFIWPKHVSNINIGLLATKIGTAPQILKGVLSLILRTS